MKDLVDITLPDAKKQGSLYLKDRLQRGLYNFIGHESFGGILLFVCVVIAMIVANTSSLSSHYFSFWNSEVGIMFNNHIKQMSILHLINDVLMSFFFLMVGLEMKREVLYGDLAGFKKVSFSTFAAIGGICVPIVVYLYFNHGTPSANGFGVAMSTDTAFALGVILLMGKRIPPVIKIFLVTLAVADDLGAVSVIAIFYTEHLDMNALYCALLILGVLIYINWRDTKHLSLYFILGVLLWIAVYKSGIHPTIAAVILAFCIPGKTKVSGKYFEKMIKEWDKIDFEEIERIRNSTLKIEKKSFFKSLRDGIKNFIQPTEEKRIDMKRASDYVHILDNISHYSLYAKNPLLSLEHALQPICAYFIVPLFAFANGGVVIDSNLDLFSDGILWGTVLGLVIGKPIGIVLFAWLSEKLNISIRPKGLSYGHVLAVGFLAGIGFTMSMFVAGLAYESQNMIDTSKLSVIIASSIAVVFGIISLFFSTSSRKQKVD